MRTIRFGVYVGALALAAVLTGCAGQPGSAPAGQAPSGTTAASQPVTASGGATSSAPSAAPVNVPEQLKFTAKTLDGAAFDGASLAGKPAVLWFWAPWCPKCNAEAAGLRDVAQANATVTFVGAAGLDQVPAMQQFVQKHSLGSFVHLADSDGALWRRFGVTHQPAYAFVSASGEVTVEKHQLGKDDLARRVTALAA